MSTFTATGPAAAGRQLDFLKNVLPELIRKQNPKTIPCSHCGKLVPIKDAIVCGEEKVLCAECYSKLDVVKDQAKE